MTAASGKAEGGVELLRDIRMALRSCCVDAELNGELSTMEYYERLIERLDAHLATAAANGPGEAACGHGWLPIESAPKHGRILVWNGYFGVYSSEYTEERNAGGDVTWSGYPLGLASGNFGKWYAVASWWRTLPQFDASASTPQQGMVTVPREICDGALNYIKHVGANVTERGLAHPQQWLVDGLDAALRSGGRET